MAQDHNPAEDRSGERVIRLVRPSVVVLFGPAASGKSTFAARHFRSTQIISSDRCRGLVCDEEHDQRFHVQAFALLDFIIEQRLSINRLCVVDSTALTPAARKSLIDLARKYRVPCVLLSLEAELETCVARDQNRGAQPHGRTVGRAVIERQYRMFEEAESAVAEEGFDQIETLRDDELDGIRFEIVFRPAARVTSQPSGRAGGHLPRGASHHERAASTKQVEIGDRKPLQPSRRASPPQVRPARQPAQPAPPGEAHPSSTPNASERLPVSSTVPFKPESCPAGEAGSARSPGSSSAQGRPAEPSNQSPFSGDRRQEQEHSDER
jgi:predicted kinase